MRVAFVGAGQIGAPMSERLLAPGHELTVYARRAEVREVHAVRVPVMRADDVLIAKLLTLREHQVDYDQVLEIARNVREQIDWNEVRARTNGSPYAKAFFTLVDELGLSA